jgi:hypothetical protein
MPIIEDMDQNQIEKTGCKKPKIEAGKNRVLQSTYGRIPAISRKSIANHFYVILKIKSAKKQEVLFL